MQIVERQQFVLVEFDLVEHLVRFEGVARAGDDELLRRLDLLVAEDVAAQMQAHLAPVADGEDRALDLVEPPVRRAHAPEVVVEIVVDDLADQIEFHRRPAVPSGRAVLVVGAQARVPDRAVAAINPAVIVRAAVLIDQPVIRRDAGEPRRRVGRHQPLRHRVIRLADAADAAVAPRLLDDPGNELEIVLLLVQPHELELALGLARAAHVGVDVGVALLRRTTRPGRSRATETADRPAPRPSRIGRARRQTASETGRARRDDTRRAIS